MVTLIVVAGGAALMALAPKYGAESREGFDERHPIR
jgi:hypothetical protein